MNLFSAITIPSNFANMLIEFFKKNKLYHSKRFFIVILMFFGNMNLTALYVNLSIGIIGMTSKKNLGNASYEDAEFNWNSKEKGFILSMFSYGTFFSPLGGALALMYGGVTMYGLGILGTAFTTMLTPILIRLNIYLYMFFRLLEGILEIMSISSSGDIFAKWIPSDELPILSCLPVLGSYFGSFFIYAIAGLLTALWGWPGIFYISGFFALIYGIIWLILVRNDPRTDKFISKEEQMYLNENIPVKTLIKNKIPWKDIITCKPIWTLWVLDFSFGCNKAFTNIILPLYIKDRSSLDVSNIGYISSAVQIPAMFALPLFSCLATYLRNKKILSVTKINKLFVSLGYVSIGIISILLTYLDLTGAIICMSIVTFLTMAGVVVSLVMPVDLARQYTSLIYGISRAFFGVGSAITPIFIGYITSNHLISEWNLCFVALSVVNFIAGVFFLIYGSGKSQSWIDSNNGNSEERT